MQLTENSRPANLDRLAQSAARHFVEIARPFIDAPTAFPFRGYACVVRNMGDANYSIAIYNRLGCWVTNIAC